MVVVAYVNRLPVIEPQVMVTDVHAEPTPSLRSERK